jgi:hypothetical protein
MAFRHLHFHFSNGKTSKFHVISSNILDFCYQFDTVIGTGWHLLKDSKLLYDIRKNSSSEKIRTWKKSNLNSLINYILQNTSRLSQIFCASHPSESVMNSVEVFLHNRLSRSKLCADTYAVTRKILLHQTQPK